MTDLPLPLFSRIAAVLESQRTAIGRHAHLLDAQRAALRADDLELLAELACQAAELLEGLEDANRGLRLVSNQIEGAAGSRAETVRVLRGAVAAELGMAFAGVRQFTEMLQGRRRTLMQAIQELEGRAMTQPGRGFRGRSAEPSILDQTG